MNDGDIKFIEGWEAAKNRIWQQPDGLCSGWLSDLPAGVRVPMPAVIDMLAFGRAMQPDGLSEADVWRDRILSTRALLQAAASSAVVICGQPAERWKIGAYLPITKPIGAPEAVSPQVFAGDALTLSPLMSGWLAPANIAAAPALWGTPEAVSYIDLMVDRKSLGAWFGKLSGNVARSRKRGQDKVITIAANLWPGGSPPDGLSVKQRNRMIRAEDKRLFGLISTLDSKTIDAAFKAAFR